MKELKDNLEYLLEMETQQQRLDKLIRQGLMPSRQLPILHRALANIKMGKILAPYEREALSKLLDKMMGFQFGDDVTYNRARLYTQKTKYQTEENTMSEEDVKVFDGSEDEEEVKRDKKVKKKGSSKQARDAKKDDEAVTEAVGNRPADKEEGDKESPKQGGSEKPKIDEPNIKQDSKPSIKEGLISDLDSEGMRQRANRLGGKFGKKSKEERLKALPAALRKEKQKAGLSEEDIAAIGNDPEDLEARLMEFSETQRGIIEGLPEEALVSNQLDSLLKGMENGDIPTWASPAVAAVEQMLARRGLEASSVGRDNLFNAIIQSAVPLAQSNAQAIQASVAQTRDIESREELANAQMQQQTAMQNASNVFQMDMAQFSADQQTTLSNSKFL